MGHISEGWEQMTKEQATLHAWLEANNPEGHKFDMPPPRDYAGAHRIFIT